MRVAITSSGNTLDSDIDSRFGRCAYLAVYDLENHTTEFIPNPNKDKVEGAGPATVQLVASLNVQKVVSGEFGDKVKAIFDSLQIQLIILKDPGKKVREIIDLLSR